ncbi:calmodulin-lysine N-methyltransferase-like [Ptychodera flava]|uniref:calmodulin-lysine N-methyltransferase-like n=1 Tax=Ptychodera flava TaxID=63121 RepID=UPI00396A12C1
MASGSKTCHSLSPRRMVMSAARQRWRLLGQVIARKRGRISRSENNSVSKRRFSSYGLMITHPLENKACNNDRDAVWYEYTCAEFPQFKLNIRQLTGPLGIEELTGFNNTGNVCVWPSEEVLTYHCLNQIDSFRDKTVCELGGGMTCLAGIAIAAFSEAKEVLLTDGNETSVENVKLITKGNESLFGSTVVKSSVIKWDRDAKYTDLAGRFDHIICSDCLFFDQFREDLLHVIYTLLKADGLVTVLAPCRGNTLEKFCEMAKDGFEVERRDNYDTKVWEKHLQAKSKMSDGYDEDIHYPVLLFLRKLKLLTPPHRVQVQGAKLG